MSNDEVKLPELPEPPQPNTYQFAYSDIPYEAISAYEQGFDEATDIMHGQLHAYARIAVLADRAGRWVPVTERMPEGGMYLVAFDDGGPMDAWVYDDDAPSDWLDNGVTHWQPMPPAPEGE